MSHTQCLIDIVTGAKNQTVLVLEPLGDLTLQQVLKAIPPADFDLNQARRILKRVITLVSVLHKRGYIHRNINLNAIGMKK